MSRLISLLLIISSCTSQNKDDMIHIEEQSFQMGSDNSLAHEGPEVTIHLDEFYIEKTEVTNEQFLSFTEETGYLTTAESEMYNGSVVFNGEWKFVEGANWRHPYGASSSIDSIMDHPVVHVSWLDAKAYCEWKNRRLPTEAEWELASKLGDDKRDPEKFNHWQGQFPTQNKLSDGWSFTAPVGSYPADKIGLFDMKGNVWEWCEDKYFHEVHEEYLKSFEIENPVWTGTSYDPRKPMDKDLHVIKGGSFLCSSSYCLGYKPEARLSAKSTESYSHIGFRCACD